MEAHCAALGVDPGASAEVVRQAYRVLALRWHPDKQEPGAGAAAKRLAAARFLEVQAAYEALSAVPTRTGSQEWWSEELERSCLEREQQRSAFAAQLEAREARLEAEEAQRRRAVAALDAAFEARLEANRRSREASASGERVRELRAASARTRQVHRPRQTPAWPSSLWHGIASSPRQPMTLPQFSVI
mmetsp:Transcript_2393/g.5341  ORF Transcript_2393/g.5341 Transcript_2393/m.5341 type:complete len:188 (+) Transcript_2393:91-654(+)